MHAFGIGHKTGGHCRLYSGTHEDACQFHKLSMNVLGLMSSKWAVLCHPTSTSRSSALIPLPISSCIFVHCGQAWDRQVGQVYIFQ